MNLSLELVAERLKNKESFIEFHDLSDRFCLQRPEFFTGIERLESNILYISRAEDIKEGFELPEEGALICVGECPQLAGNSSCMTLPGEVDILRLSNEIHEIFRMFHRWEQELKNLVFQDPLEDVFRKMLELSDPILENGLSLMDAAFYMLIQTDTNRKYGGYENATDYYTPEDLAPDIMTMLRSDPGYQAMAEREGIFLLDNNILPHRTINWNIFVEGKFVYRLVITECIRPFHKSDETLLILLAEQIRRIVQPVLESHDTYNYPLAGFFTDMIRKDIISRTALEAELAIMNWKTTDQFCMLCLRASHVSGTDDMEQYYCMELMKEFPECFAFRLEHAVAVVVNQSISSNTPTEFFQKLAMFIRDNNYRAGSSNSFQDLYRIRRYYREAEIVLEIGQEKNPSVWRHSFQDYVLSYIYRMATSEFETEELYSPIYNRILQYDQANGTELLKTLQCFLDNQMNTLRTAQELYIHRSTMIYRLKRIHEIGKTNLSDRQELLHLQLTFDLLLAEQENAPLR